MLVIVPAVALNVVEVEAAGTVTEAGAVSRVLLSDSETTVPPVGAAELKVTVQVLATPEINVVGVQDNELRDGAVAPPVTVPPIVEIVIAVPTAEDPAALVIPIAVLVTPAATVRFTTAMVPLGMMRVFMP